MIVRDGMDVWRMVRLLGPMLAGLLAYDVALTLMYTVFHWRWLGIESLPLPLLGSAIALVVTLRNNTAYARWWEARTLWGSALNNTRSFARNLQAAIDDPALRRALIQLQIAYMAALRCHLLRQEPWPDIAQHVPPETLEALQGAANVPLAIQLAMARLLAEARAKGQIDSTGLLSLNPALSAMMDAQGGMERIKNTPLPAQFNQIPALFTTVYCVVLPMGLLTDLGTMTPVGSTLIGFMFLALDRIGRDVENPFEGTLHDVPMKALARTAEIDLMQAAGLEGVPKALGPVDGVLW